MTKRMIRISTMKEADEFNKLCGHFECDMDLMKGKYYVNAKSIMGIFSLDLSTEIEFIADTDDVEKIDEVFKKFIVE